MQHDTMPTNAYSYVYANTDAALHSALWTLIACACAYPTSNPTYSLLV